MNQIFQLSRKSSSSKPFFPRVTVSSSLPSSQPTTLRKIIRQVTNQEKVKIKENFRIFQKKKQQKRNFGDSKQKLKIHDIRNWMKKHGKGCQNYFSQNQTIQLKKFFKALDKDNSGNICTDELYIPFKSLGLIQSRQQIEQLISQVDQNNNGLIQFHQFIKVAKYFKELNNKSKLSQFFKIMTKQKKFQRGVNYSFQLFLSKTRRDSLMHTVRSSSPKSFFNKKLKKLIERPGKNSMRKSYKF